MNISKRNLMFTLCILLYKGVLEIGYFCLLTKIDITYTLDIDIYKYIVGWITVFILSIFIKHSEKSISSFGLNLHLIIGIIPMTIIFSMSNESWIYYLTVASAFFLVELYFIVSERYKIINEMVFKNINKYIYSACLFIVLGIGVYIIITNGLPTLTALNISNVYELRRENYFIKNKYIGYAYSWMTYVIIPFMIGVTIKFKKYILTAGCFVFVFILYLYSGDKTTLFSIPLIIAAIFFSKFKNTNIALFTTFFIGIVSVTGIYILTNEYWLYSAFVRRVMILPAQIKFNYYDYMLTHEPLGMATTYIGSLMGSVNPYPEGLSSLIGFKYYGSIENNANTGFMAEGYARFGIIGVLVAFILFAILLKALDNLQKKTSYRFALIVSIYLIFSLNDGAIIDSFITGPVLIIFLISIFYNWKGKNYEEELLH